MKSDDNPLIGLLLGLLRNEEIDVIPLQVFHTFRQQVIAHQSNIHGSTFAKIFCDFINPGIGNKKAPDIVTLKSLIKLSVSEVLVIHAIQIDANQIVQTIAVQLKKASESFFPANEVGIVIFTGRHINNGHISPVLKSKANQFCGHITTVIGILTDETEL